MATNANQLAKSGKFGDLRRRLLFLLGALVVYRIGAHIPVPGIDPAALQELFNQQRGTILDMFNMFSGGALRRFSLFALGIMPYISASIILQLLTVVHPKLEQTVLSPRRQRVEGKLPLDGGSAEALAFAPRMLYLEDGRVIADGPTGDLLAAPSAPGLRRYLGG